jgi:metallo-beta-lactamase family protein
MTPVESEPVKLTFLGAAGEVTGSCYLVETDELAFLVDCGMVQGGRGADARNRRFAFDPREIAFVLLTHAHIDHSGLIPRLVAQGFTGAVYTTEATGELLGVMLPDSAHLQEKESQWSGAEPLYTVQQTARSLQRLIPAPYDAEIRPHPTVRCRFRDAGHILGSAIIEVWAGKTKIVFSGDLGQPGHPIVQDATAIEEADVLLVESTYGNRDHKSLAQTLEEFACALNDTLDTAKGNVVIPAFAVGRTQDVLYFISELSRQGRIGSHDVYVDSPMALAATRIMLKHPELYDSDAARMVDWLQHAKGGPRVHFTEDVEDSKRINSVRSGAVIISASGMCEGGRIKHHLRWNLSRPECAIVFVGFQAAGTLGRSLVDGATSVRLQGEPCPVRAKIFTIGGLSAHAGQSALLAWLAHFKRPPRQTWVVHGEALPARALRDAIETRYGWRATVPANGESALVR